MKIAILTPVHGSDSAKRVIAQIRNYHLYFDPSTEVQFYLHASRASSDKFKEELVEYQLVSPYSLLMTKRPRETSVRSALGALIQLGLDLRNDQWQPDYVLWHTDSDLMIKKGIESEMSKYSHGIGSSEFNLERSRWNHVPKMRADPRVANLVHQCLDNDKYSLRIGKTECAFMEFSLWEKTSECINQFFGDSFFEDVANHWCAEEILLPTLAARFATSNSRSRQQLCSTKLTVPDDNRDPGESKININDIEAIRKQGYFYCAKWFSPDLNDDSRIYLANHVE